MLIDKKEKILMLKFMLKRIGSAITVLFGVSIIVFTLVHMQPGNPYSTMIDPSVSPKVIEQKLEKLGYYDPIPVKYVKWVGRAITGDFGYSINYKTPVFNIIMSRLGNTLLISVISLVISTFIAILIGVLSASKPKSILDYGFTFVSFVGVSVPTFFLGLLLVKWLAFDLGVLPASGMMTLGENYTGIKKIMDVGKHMIMPVIVLSITQAASLLRYTRSSMLEVMSKDYIRTARAKGLSRNKTIWIHGFRNSLISIVTVICMQIPTMFSGALITETVFVWPGIGMLNYEAILNRDYPLIMGITMLLAVIIVLSNLLADLLYAVVDPRIRVVD